MYVMLYCDFLNPKVKSNVIFSGLEDSQATKYWRSGQERSDELHPLHGLHLLLDVFRVQLRRGVCHVRGVPSQFCC